jgi:WD40 repeat protein
MFKHRLQIAEFVFILGSVVGWVIAIWSGQLIYAALPISIAMLLNLINRLHFEQRMRRGMTALMSQWHRQLLEESYAQHQQQLEQAIAALKAQIPEYLAQLETPELELSALKIIQFRGQLVSLEQSLYSIVHYLNSASLPSRVERLEEAIASASAEITWISRQLTNARTSQTEESEWQLQTNQPEDAQAPISPSVTESQFFTPEPKESAPVEKPQDVSVSLPTWRLWSTLGGHSDWVHSLAISPDGRTLASGSFDKTIKLWQLSTGQLIHTLSKHSKGVLCVAISPDGKTLASGSFDETIKLWRLDTGELIDTLKGHSSSVRSLAISPDSQTLISGSFDETIKLWRLDTGEFLGNLTKTAGQVAAIALSRDGQTLASGGSDGLISLRLLDTADGEIKPSPALTLTGNLSSVCSLAISPDGEILAAGCTDGNVKLWQLSTLEPLNLLQGNSGPMMTVAFSMDAPILFSGSADGTIGIWHLETGQQIGILSDDSDSSVMAVAICPDGRAEAMPGGLIASGGADSTIKIWQRCN